MTYDTIRDMLAEELGLGEELVTPDTRLFGGGPGAVSLARLIIRCEREFGITIHDDEAASITRLADLAAYVDRALADGRDRYRPLEDRDREAWYYR